MIDDGGIKAPFKLTPETTELTANLQKKLKLKKATRDFEAIFITQMLSSMRRASSSGIEQGDGFGKDVMLTIADEAVAKQLAKTGMLGIGDLLYQRLLKRIGPDNIPQKTITQSLGEISRRKSSLAKGEEKGVVGIYQAAKNSPLNPTLLRGTDSPNAARLTTESVNRTTDDKLVVPAKAGTQRKIHLDSGLRRNDKAKRVEAKPPSFAKEINYAARQTGLSSKLIEAMIRHESGGNPKAISSRGAVGLMQLMPDTAVEVGVKNRFDPQQNILGGAKYLRSLLDRFNDLKLALAAYNAGPTKVEQYGGIPPFQETADYVRKIFVDLAASK